MTECDRASMDNLCIPSFLLLHADSEKTEPHTRNLVDGVSCSASEGPDRRLQYTATLRKLVLTSILEESTRGVGT